jgi:uroporphyrinogen decarboxylase
VQEESDLDKLSVPDIDHVPEIKALPENVKAAKEKGIPTAASVLGPLDQPYYFMRRFEDYMMDFALHPEFTRRMIAFCAEHILLKVVDRALEAGVDLIYVADDLGGEKQPFISPSMYREFIVDWLSEICYRAHRAGAFVEMHCDGNIMSLMDDIVAAGVDAINPVAPGDTDLRVLKQKYGDRLSFRGGLSRHIARMTPQGLVEHWQDRLRIAAPGGGYCIGPSGGISWDTPREVADLLIRMTTTKGCVSKSFSAAAIPNLAVLLNA